MEQQEMQWDKASNLLSTIAKQRFDTASDTELGELGDPDSESPVPQARVSYFASYPDALGRTVASANYGTNGGVAWSRSETIPLASDTILVSSTFYDGAGNATRSTDAAGIVNTKVFDNADRLITTIENDAETGSRTTHYEYTDDAWLRKLISENPVTGTQVTEWLRGVTPSQGSALYSNRLVYQKIYPDSVNGGVRVTYLYNRQLQVTGMTDQAGTTHEYFYDQLGRLLSDTVTAFGADIDEAVSKLETTYNRKGLVEDAHSKGAGGSIISKVSNSAYTLFNQLSTQVQWRYGSWDPYDDFPIRIDYHYEDGSAGTIRSTALVYPHYSDESCPVLDFNYTSDTAQALNRIDQLKEGTDVLSSWRYLGLGTVVGQKYDGAANTELTMQNGGTGDAGDPYTGLDRFGRLVETIWKSGSTELVHSRYGRNRVGGVEWRRDVKAHSLIPEVKTQDNYYRYDGLQQVTRHDRGELVPSSGPGYTGIDPNPVTHKQQEIFTFDETGNWMTDYNAASSLSQSRAQNVANEITSITPTSTVVQPTYDPAGNMRTVPQPADWEQGYDLKWDAWNRLVEVKNGETVIASYVYDALSRRIITKIGSEHRHYYYDNQWRTIEERVTSGGIPTDADRQYVWNPFNRWNLIRRKRNAPSYPGETRYVIKDYLDPVALVNIIDSAAVVDERYSYDAFGSVNIMDADFEPRTSSVCDWNFLFHAEFKDLDTGLYNYGYRYYHPNLGRWISKDPIGERGGLNLYSFVKNKAPRISDYLGLKININVPPGSDSAKQIAALQEMFKTICDLASFSGGIVIIPNDIASSKTPKGCCCLKKLAQSPNNWTIEGKVINLGPDGKPTDVPHTSSGDGSLVRPLPEGQVGPPAPGSGSGGVVITPLPGSNLDWGSLDPNGKPRIAPLWRVLGHELCGHAVYSDSGRELPQGPSGNRPTHDQAIDAENELAAEHNEPPRGHFNDPPNEITKKNAGNHGGESFFWPKNKPLP